VRTPLALAAAQLRRGRRGLLGVTLLVALVGGVALAGFAGAQRTSTAVDRMIDDTEAADVLINPDRGDESELDFDAVAALPMVAEFSRGHGVALVQAGPVSSLDEFFSAPFTLAKDGRGLIDFDRPVISDGRMFDPTAIDEVFLDRTYAESAGLEVGDEFVYRVVAPDEFAAALGPLEEAEGSEDADMATLLDDALTTINSPGFGREARLVVVGIGSLVDGIVVDAGFEPVAAHVSPAFYDHYGEPSAGFGGAILRLEDPSDLAAVTAAIDAMVPDELIVYATLDGLRTKAVRGTQPAAVALVIFAVVTAVLGLVLIAQAVSRRLQAESRDVLTLAALGTTRGERATASLLGVAAAAILGAAFAVVVAVGLSWWTPVGPARIAEPDPGVAAPGAIVLGGAALLAVLVVALSIGPAWRVARVHPATDTTTGSAVARWIADRGAPPAVTNGVRFGLEPGRGPTAVPTRATITAAATAIAVGAATIVFAGSLDRVVDDGRFYGTNFDLTIDAIDGEVDLDFVDLARSDPAVERSGLLLLDELVIAGWRTPTIAFSSGDDPIAPTIAEGRAPTGAREIALGAATLSRFGVGVGDTVAIAGFDGSFDVVGRAVLPGVGLYQGADRTSIGDGALVAEAAFDERGGPLKRVVVGLEPGSDAAAVGQRLNALFDPIGGAFIQSAMRPADIESLEALRSLPVVLSSALALIVAVNVVNALVMAVRQRRRDVAVLRALGSTNGAVAAMGFWQGATVAVAGLLVGVPLGVVAGRWLWTVLANNYGTFAEPIVSLTALATLGAAVIVIASVSAVVPARRGLRLRTADVLRSE
jgi:hypothetical protein